jgi:hypothetical protein
VSTSALVRFVMRGTINSSQTWSTGFWNLVTGSPINSTSLFTWLSGQEDIVDAWWNTGPKAFNAATHTLLTNLDAYYYPAGATKATVSAGVQLGTALAGSGTAGNAQTALVVTTYTGHAGKSGRGRLYVPLTAQITHDTVSILQLTDCQSLADATATLIGATASNSGGGLDMVPAVATPQVAGPGLPIISVAVDQRTDSQRRRADKILSPAIATADI